MGKSNNFLLRSRQLIALFDERERRAFLPMLALMASSAILDMLAIGLLPMFLYVLQKPESIRGSAWATSKFPFLGQCTEVQVILGAAALVIGAFSIKNAFGWFVLSRQYDLMHKKMHDLSVKLYAKYLRSPYVFHLERNSSILFRNVMNECSTVVSMVLLPVSLLIIDVLTTIFLCALLTYKQPILMLGAVSFFGSISYAFYRYIRNRAHKLGETHQAHARVAAMWVNQGFGGVKELRVVNRMQYFTDAFGSNWRVSTTAQSKYHLLNQMPRFFNEVTAISAMLLLAVTLLSWGVEKESVVVTLTLFGAATFRLIPTFSRMVSSLSSIRFAFPSVETVCRDLAEDGAPSLEESVEAGKTDLLSFDQISFDRVDFSYPGAKRKALDSVSFTIPRGSIVGVVGSSGAGKTTLADVALGLLKPDSGRVLAGAVDIYRQKNRWQGLVGYIPQSIFLLDDSIRRNVAFGVHDEHIDEEAVNSAIRAAQLEGFVANLPNGLATEVGERGVRLSGGQRQRIGIARALYHDPKFLILDEATSALDNQTELDVSTAVRSIAGGITILIIAHRMTTVRNCDCLYFMREGRIVHFGTFESLMETAPDFKRLVEAGDS